MSARSASDPSCATVRDALSARLDGEALGLSASTVDAHLRGCVACDTHHQRSLSVGRQLRLAEAAPVPELTDRIMAALDEDGLRARSVARRRRETLARAAVGVVGGLQIALAVPLLVGFTEPSTHLLRHLGTLEFGLGVGLVVAAIQPRRAAGLLPILLVVAAASLLVAIPDVVSGGASVLVEALHLTEFVALAGVWWLVRSRPSRSGTPRRMAADLA